MRVTVGSQITIDEPTMDIKMWCIDNLILTNPEYIKKQRMGFWLGNTPARIYLFEQRGEQLVLPYGCLKKLKEILPIETPIINGFSPVEHVYYGADLLLWDYQTLAVEELFVAKSGILVAPAGSGKTQISLGLINMFNKKALWLTHTKDLLNQSKNRALKFFDKSLIGTITEGKVELGKGITFATIQTMCRLDLSKYENYFDVIVVDECHRVSGSATTVTQFYKVLSSLAARHKYGLTATAHRADGLIKATFALLGDIAYEVPKQEVDDKIMQVGIKTIYTGVDMPRNCLNGDGTINYMKYINELCTTFSRNELIVNSIVKDVPSIILSDRLSHLETLMYLMPREERKKAVMISGKMTSVKGKAERQQALDDMRNGNKKYLFATYNLCKEGLDIPCLQHLYMATPQTDFAVITQSIGRIARIHEGKGNPVCYDFVDYSGYANRQYKKRCSAYKKNNCYFMGDENAR